MAIDILGAFRKLSSKLVNMIKTGTLVSSDDSKRLPTCTVKYNGKTQKALLLAPYGLIGQPPTNSLCLLFAIGGQESKQFAIADDPANRKKDLQEGEVGLNNYEQETYILLKSDGTVEIGQGSFRKLITEAAVSAINSHVHPYLNGSTPSYTSASETPLVSPTDLTDNTRAS